jgi:hypothetical protein
VTAAPSNVDTELFELAEVVLRQYGFDVDRLTTDGIPYLLAEDQDSVLVLTSVVGINDVMAVEPELTRVLAARVATASIESKRWDCYVIVITNARPDERMGAAISSVAYNLSDVRRLIRVGVDTTRADVERSLRAILPLSGSVGEEEMLYDPLAALGERLIADGLSAPDVEEAIAAFRMTLPDPADIRALDGALETNDADAGYGEADVDDE